MGVISRQRLIAAQRPGYTWHRREQRLQSADAVNKRPRSRMCKQGRIPCELQRIAQTLLGIQQQRFAGGRGSVPRLARIDVAAAAQLGQDETPLVFAPPLRE